MFTSVLLFSSLFALSHAPAEEVRCSPNVLVGGPSEEILFVHAVATGERRALQVPEASAQRGEALPDSAVAFEFRVIGAEGGSRPPAGGDLILVTPWSYDAACLRMPWEGGWVEPEEETVLTIWEGWGGSGGLREFHVRGRVGAYPQGSWHWIRGRTYREPGPGPDWLTAAEYFELVSALPAFWPSDPAARFDAAARAVEILESSAAAWSERYPGTELFRQARWQVSRGVGAHRGGAHAGGSSSRGAAPRWD